MSNESFIDKLAYIHIRNQKLLVTLSKGNSVWYIPGGKREAGEADEDALIREVEEELTVSLIPTTIRKYGTFEAQAHGKAVGTIVRMRCYQAEYQGELRPSSEIFSFDFFSYGQKKLTSPVDNLIFEDLKRKGLIR